MTKIELLEMLKKYAMSYRKDKNSVSRNKHLTLIEEEPVKGVKDGILVDFINHVGMRMGIDYALSVEDLMDEDEKTLFGYDEEVTIPSTIEEAIALLDEELTDEDKQYILKNGALSVHHSLGMWIRNNWGLWENSELKDYYIKQGITHPDDMSNRIIQDFIKYLKSK